MFIVNINHTNISTLQIKSRDTQNGKKVSDRDYSYTITVFPTLTGKHNLIGKIPVHNVFPYLAQSHVLVTKRWYIQKTQIRVMK